MPILLILVLVLQLAVGARLGAALRRNHPATSGRVISGLCLYVILCSILAALAVQYPGPASQYAAGSGGSHIRRMVIGPAQWLWICGPLVIGFGVAYFRAGKLYADRQQTSPLWYVHSILISVLFLPFWLAGLVLHMAHYAGTWF